MTVGYRRLRIRLYSTQGEIKMRFTKEKIVAAICSAALLGTACTAVLSDVTVAVAADSVQITEAGGWFEAAYAQWTPVSNASGYNVYADGTQIDSMLIRQYNGYYRADAVGLKAGSHTIKIVPLIGGSEDSSKAASQTVSVSAHDRTGFAWVSDSAYTTSTASGAYNEDGTLRSGAVVLYVTEQTKDTVSLDVVTSSKGATTACTGIQNILTSYQKGYDTRPLDIRCIGNITDPSTLMATARASASPAASRSRASAMIPCSTASVCASRMPPTLRSATSAS